MIHEQTIAAASLERVAQERTFKSISMAAALPQNSPGRYAATA